MKNMISLIRKYTDKLCRKAAEFLKTRGAAVGLPVASGDTPCPTTVGDVIRAHSVADLALSERSRRAHERALLNMAEVVVRYRQGLARVERRGGRCGDLGYSLADTDYPLAASLPLTALDEQFVGEFIAAAMEEFAVESAKWFAAYDTTASQVAKAKAMFTPAALVSYREAGLNIPANIASFYSAKSLDQPMVNMVPPSVPRLDAAISDLQALEACNEDMFLAAALAFFAGLRCNEIVAGHVDWLLNINGTALRVSAGESRERVVPLPEWFYTRLRSRNGYFITGATARERAEKCSATAMWLRQHGSAGVSRPLAEYRVFFAWYITSMVPAEQATSILGHASIETTLRHYENEGLVAACVSLWNRLFSALPPSAET